GSHSAPGPPISAPPGARAPSQRSLDHYEPPVQPRGQSPWSFRLLVRTAGAGAAAAAAADSAGPLASVESAGHAGRTRASPASQPLRGCCFTGNSPSNLRYKGVSLSSPAGPVAAVLRELRCICLHTTQRDPPKMISNLQVFAPGPQCSKVEVIASMKNGEEVCLDPETPFLKKVIQKILDGGNRKTD
uniref:Chemokine interleukin-8-like domain-containing protein n=1 Tax=Callithrix jacchus TaxID=9483 RepID=A0A2R8MJP4_CALJA